MNFFIESSYLEFQFVVGHNTAVLVMFLIFYLYSLIVITVIIIKKL